MLPETLSQSDVFAYVTLPLARSPYRRAQPMHATLPGARPVGRVLW